MNFLEYFKDYTLRNTKNATEYEEKVRAEYACETKNVRIIFFDLETSSPCERSYPIASADSIIEIGAVCAEAGTFSRLCNPGHPIFTTAVNGISTEDVKDCPHTNVVLGEFLDWAAPNANHEATLLVAHNAAQFDLKVLRAHIARYFPGNYDNIYVGDSLQFLKCHSGAEKGNLQSVYRHIFQEDYVEKHRAEEDAKDLEHIMNHLAQKKELSILRMLSGSICPLVSKTMKPKANVKYFDVPFQEKDIAKRMGAKWDPVKKRWFAPTDVVKAALLTKFKST